MSAATVSTSGSIVEIENVTGLNLKVFGEIVLQAAGDVYSHTELVQSCLFSRKSLILDNL